MEVAIVHGVKRRRPRAFRLPVVGGEDVANVVHLERGWWIGVVDVVETGDARVYMVWLAIGSSKFGFSAFFLAGGLIIN